MNVLVLIFVGDLQGSLILSSGQEPATEGDALELTCNLTSISLPSAYRPSVYYSWRIQYEWQSETNSSGTVMDSKGNIISGYMIKNNGRTLVINSVQYYDKHIDCRGREDGGTPSVHRSHSVKIRREK